MRHLFAEVPRIPSACHQNPVPGFFFLLPHTRNKPVQSHSSILPEVCPCCFADRRYFYNNRLLQEGFSPAPASLWRTMCCELLFFSEPDKSVPFSVFHLKYYLVKLCPI